MSGMLTLHTNWHTDWLCVKNVYFLGWVFGIFTRFRSQYSRRSKEIHCRREELERKLTAFPLYQWKAEEMAHTVWKGPLVGNDMQSRMKCVVWEAKGGYSSVGEEEEGRSLRGSCFAGHRSQQPAASYITCLPPIIIITVIFIAIFNSIVIFNAPMLL